MAKKPMTPAVIGGSSLLVIFAVLCLTVFSLLSLATVRADGKIGDSAAASVAAYYAADCRAEALLARLRAGEMPEGVTEENGIYSYRCPISDTQALWVQVELTDTDYTVLRWQAMPADTRQADDSLPVWNGESQ